MNENIIIVDNIFIKDTYMDTDICANRLFEEYKKYGNLIVAFDFDETVYSEEDTDNHSQMVELLQACNKLGFELIVYTCRPENEWNFVKDYLSSINISFTGINIESKLTSFPKSKEKIFYNIFFEDRAGLKSAYETMVRCISLILQERGDL